MTRYYDTPIDVECPECGEMLEARYNMGRYDFEVIDWPRCPVHGVIESDAMYELIHDTAASFYASAPGARDYTPKGGY